MVPLSIPCGSTAIRIYEKKRGRGEMQHVLYRAAFTVLGPMKKKNRKQKSKREWGSWAPNIRGTLAVLLPKLKLKESEKNAVWSEIQEIDEMLLPAMRHTTEHGTLPSAVAYFKKHPFEGILRTYTRAADQRVRMKLCRLDSNGHTHEQRLESNWHDSREEAFAYIQAKCARLGREVPATNHMPLHGPGVAFVHQIYGVFRDDKVMDALFNFSSEAWKAYADDHQSQYKLWTADEVDTLIQQKAPEWLQHLYTTVRFPVQRVDVVRFFILYLYGGLYADLDVFPNRETFPLVPLGMCKMKARETPCNRNGHEWEIEVVVGRAGNWRLMEILKGMLRAVAAKQKLEYYSDKPCRFIYYTTGPKGVGKTLRTKGYEPQVTVFSMCRPVPDLVQQLNLDTAGKVCCQLPGFNQYDVWSSFSMSYNTSNPGTLPGLAPPLARLPPLCPTLKMRQRCTVKTTPAPEAALSTSVKEEGDTAELDAIEDEDLFGSSTDEGSQGLDEDDLFNGFNEEVKGDPTEVKKEIEAGYEPQRLHLHNDTVSREAQSALEDIADLFLTKKDKSTGWILGFRCLKKETRKVLFSIHKKRT